MSLRTSDVSAAHGGRDLPDGRQPPMLTQQADWDRSDEYHNSFLVKKDGDLKYAQDMSRKAGLPDIAVSEAQGKLLYLLAKSIKAKRALEVGTLGGYSSIWIAKALPADGHLVTLELDAKHAKVATENVQHAGLASKVSVLVGPAVKTLSQLPSEEPFDLAFIDADKPNNTNYFKEAERLVRPGGVILVDNVGRRGRVADLDVKDDESVEGVRELLRYIQTSNAVDATTIATVGTKGYDGFLYAWRME